MWGKKRGTCLVEDVFFLEGRIKMDMVLNDQLPWKMETEIKLWRGSDAMPQFCHDNLSGFNLASQTITGDLLDV